MLNANLMASLSALCTKIDLIICSLQRRTSLVLETRSGLQEVLQIVR